MRFSFRWLALGLPVALIAFACSSTPTSVDVTPDGGTEAGTPTDPNCGRLTTPCGAGGACEGALDCKAQVCREKVCRDATPADGVKNGDETDVDCGGTHAPACADGKGCLVKDDCVSAVCKGSICQVPTATDGVKNGDETGVDCGGSKAPKCPTGEGCNTDNDCNKVKCDTVLKKCRAPAYDDGIKNGDETGIDCGGPKAPKRCPPGQGCAGDADCDNVRCNTTTLVCNPPTATDGLKNGTETDVDCGGNAAPGCAVGLACKLDGDCGSIACNYGKKCVESRSCKPQHGGDTCGTAAAPESCCKTIALAGAPGGAVNLDKFNITAGRFRTFVEATNGNLRGYIQANVPAWWNAAWDAFLPVMLDSGGTDPDFTGLYQELAPTVHAPGAEGANEGCVINGYGARTYRLPDAINTRMSDPQYFTQAVLDERPINCVTAYMLAAFCAWDGGKMPTRQLIDYAWGAQKYPWGTADPAGYSFAYPADPVGALGFQESYGGFQSAPVVDGPLSAASLLSLKYANYNYNYWGGITVNDALPSGRDYSFRLSQPGRFPLGDGPFGHADLAGSVFNATDIVGTGVYWSRSGSWQGHNIPWSPPGSWLNVLATNKYWAMGGRCAR